MIIATYVQTFRMTDILQNLYFFFMHPLPLQVSNLVLGSASIYIPFTFSFVIVFFLFMFNPLMLLCRLYMLDPYILWFPFISFFNSSRFVYLLFLSVGIHYIFLFCLLLDEVVFYSVSSGFVSNFLQKLHFHRPTLTIMFCLERICLA